MKMKKKAVRHILIADENFKLDYFKDLRQMLKQQLIEDNLNRVINEK